MFGPLNEIELSNRGQFNRGSFFFQEKKWTQTRMADIMYEVADRSIHYYFSKYGKAAFRQ
jgi:type II restriction enzyme